MPRHNLELRDEVISLHFSEKCKFVNVLAISHIIDFPSILLKFKSFQKLVNRLLSQHLLLGRSLLKIRSRILTRLIDHLWLAKLRIGLEIW